MEASLEGTGLAQSDIVEMIEGMIVDEVVSSCAKEFSGIIDDIADTVSLKM